MPGDYGFLFDAVLDAMRAAALALALLMIGAPVPVLLGTRLGAARLTAAVGIAVGLLLLSAASWYAYRFGVSVTYVYLLLLAAWLCACLLAALWRAGRCAALWRMMRVEGWAAAAAFAVPAFAWSVLSHVRIAPGNLPLLSSGNHDILSYLKAGDVLRALPDVATQVGDLNIAAWMASDVFGAINLVAFSSFLLRTGVEQCAIPLLAFAIGLIGLGMAAACRRVFALPLWLALAVVVLFTTSPLFSYVAASYFLSQLLFVGLLLAALTPLAEAADRESGTLPALAAILVCAAGVMFVYHAWFAPYVLLVSGAFGVLPLMRGGGLTPSGLMRAAGAGVSAFVLMNVFCAVVGTSRYAITVDNILSAAAIADVGWPLPFINPALLLGIPAWWQTPEASPSVLGQSLPALGIVLLAGAAALRLDRGEGRSGRRFVLICFIAAALLYLLVWAVLGASYRQWKFATTLAAPLGFAVAAYILYLASKSGSRGGRASLVGASCVFIGFCLVENMAQYFERWTASTMSLSQDLRVIARADQDPAVEAVYIDAPSFGERMAAAVFVRTKPIFFSGPTYFGAGGPLASVPFRRIAVLQPVCGARNRKAKVEAAGFEVSEMQPESQPLPVVSPGNKIDFSGPTSGCLLLTGFSGTEPWGTWTDGRQASIRARCACDLAGQPLQVVLRTGAFLIPGTLDRQRAVIRINGGAPQAQIFDTGEPHSIKFDIPPAAGDAGLIDIKIELPDATSPATAGAADTRVLGLSVVSLEFTQKVGK